MTLPHHAVDRAGFIFELLDWLEDRDVPPEQRSEALAVLSSERRRHLLSVVREHHEGLTLADAADEVAIRESGRPLTELSADRVAQVYTSLYHDHLPRLEDAGLIEYDQQRDFVAPGWG